MKHLIYIFPLLLLFTSCGEDFFSATKEIELDEYPNQLAINARLISFNEELPEILDLYVRNLILVSETRSVLDSNDFNLIEDANIKVWRDSETPITYDFDKPSGLYIPETFEINGIESATYNLEVENPSDGTIATASIQAPANVEMLSVNYIKEDIIIDDFDVIDKVEIDIIDPPGDNYYYFKAYFKQESINQQDTFTYYNDAYVYNYSSIDGENRITFTDQLFDDTRTTLEFWVERYVYDRADAITDVVLVLWSIPKEEYDYLETLDRNNNANDNPFAEPTVVFSNIENGIGLFSVSFVDAHVVDIRE